MKLKLIRLSSWDMMVQLMLMLQMRRPCLLHRMSPQGGNRTCRYNPQQVRWRRSGEPFSRS